MLIAGTNEVGGDRPGRVRLAAIADFSATSLHGFAKANFGPRASAKSDGWPGHEVVAPGGGHDPHVISPMPAHIVLPCSHRVFSHLMRWASGVYQGLRQKHLQSYLDEFVIRFNRRRSCHAAIRSLLSVATNSTPITYMMLIALEAKGHAFRRILESDPCSRLNI